MGRYRPPQKRGSPYITQTGFESLNEEQKALWKKRRKVTQILSEAAAEGDRSENAEYIYRKKQLREMDRRIRYLDKRLAELKVVDLAPQDTSKIYFGAWVKLEDDDERSSLYRIVGPDEFDHQEEYISMDAPVAQALLGKSVDDEVSIELPKGKITYLILEVYYEE